MRAVEQARALVAAADEALPRVRKGEPEALPAFRAALLPFHALAEACPRALGLHRRHRKRLANVAAFLDQDRAAEGRRRWLEALTEAGGNPVADHLHTELEALATEARMAIAAGLPRRWGKLSGRLQRLLKARTEPGPALADCLTPALAPDVRDLAAGLTNTPGPDEAGRLHRLALIAGRLEYRLGLLPGTGAATATLDGLATALADDVHLHGLAGELAELGADLGAGWGRQRVESALTGSAVAPDDPLPDAEALARTLAQRRQHQYDDALAPWLGSGADAALAPVIEALQTLEVQT
jgi:hypothetical protein